MSNTDYWYHYQTNNNKSSWKSATIPPDTAYHVSVLSTSTPIVEGEKFDKVKYRGDFTIDIDNPDLAQAITSAQRLVEFYLSDCEIPEKYIHLYASGGKGFHVTLPSEVFSLNRDGSNDLPDRYKLFAKLIQNQSRTEGIDFSLYSKGKGHLLRTPNKQRPDGNYKVPLTVEELSDLSPESYKALVSKPRELHFSQDRPSSVFMKIAGLFAKTKIEKQTQSKGVPEVDPAEILNMFNDSHLPECITRLINWSHEKPETDTNFNGYAMQLQSFLNSVLLEEQTVDTLTSIFANCGHSTSYPTPELRKRHIQYEVAPFSSVLKFSCAAMNSVVSMDTACQTCPANLRKQEILKNSLAMEATEEGYFYIDKQKHRWKFTDFIVIPTRVFVHESTTQYRQDMWTGADFSVYKGSKEVGIIKEVRYDLFTTAAGFMRTFFACRDVWISPDLNDKLAKLILETVMVYMRENKDKIQMVYPFNSAGIHNLGENQGMAYVEASWAMLSVGASITSHLIQPVGNMAKLENRPSVDSNKAYTEETLRHLLNTSSPHITGLVLGWVCSCHLKTHLTGTLRAFPLLYLYGKLESGKTKMATLFTTLACADYRNGVLDVPASSYHPIRRAVCETMTVPRILDECGSNKMNLRKWKQIKELLKACWQGSNIPIGGVDKNKQSLLSSDSTVVNQYPASSPVVYLATETLADDPELVGRSVEVRLPRTLRQQHPEYIESFELIDTDNERWDNLFCFAKQLVSVALSRTEDEVYTAYKDNLQHTPKGLDSRPKIGYAVCLLGLDHLILTLVSRGYSEQIINEVKDIKEQTISHLQNNAVTIARSKKVTELDSVLNTVVQALSSATEKQKWYAIKGDKLLINVVQMYNFYRSFCFTNNYRIEYGRPATLINDIEEDYELIDQDCPSIRGDFTNLGREAMWHRLSLQVLEDRKIDTGVFR